MLNKIETEFLYHCFRVKRIRFFFITLITVVSAISLILALFLYCSLNLETATKNVNRAANLINEFGTEKQKQTYLPPMQSGQFGSVGRYQNGA